MKFPGRVIITRVQSTEEPFEFMSIRVDDEDARTTAFDVKMSLEEFTRALTSMYADCDIEVFDLDKLGTVGENKTEKIHVPENIYLDKRKYKEALQDLLKPYRVDGWHERQGDITNPHCYSTKEEDGVRMNYCKVVFFRNVPKAKNDA